MSAREVFPFIDGLLAKNVLPADKNLWALAYHLERYPEARAAAERAGLPDYAFGQWMREYARRKLMDFAFMLPVNVRWGGNETRPNRATVQVPIGCLKDMENLAPAAEIALRLLLGGQPVSESLYVRALRVGDTPQVWARLQYLDDVKEVVFSPAGVARNGKGIWGKGVSNDDVQVLEWKALDFPDSLQQEDGAEPCGGKPGLKHAKLGCVALLALGVAGCLLLPRCGGDEEGAPPAKGANAKPKKMKKAKKKKAEGPQLAAPRSKGLMTVNRDVAAWATQQQAAVFEELRMEGDAKMMKAYGERRFNEGDSCLMKRGEQVRVVEVGDGGFWIRVRRPDSKDAWWVDSRALDAE